MFRAKALYLTEKGARPVAGILESGKDHVKFTPSGQPGRPGGTDNNVLYLQYEDLLRPITRCDPSKLNHGETAVRGGGAHHRAEMGGSGARRKFVYLQLRVTLLFGVDITPDTTAGYCFALLPAAIDPIFDTLDEAAKTHGPDPDDRHDGEPAELARARAQHLAALPSRQRTLSHDNTISLLGGTSAMLDLDAVNALRANMPAETRLNNWTRGFSTYVHGLSLRNLFRQLARYGDGACVTTVRDHNGNVFGCYTTSTWRHVARTTTAHRYYGGGESFVFKVAPRSQVWHWSHKDNHFMTSSEDGLIVGGGAIGSDGEGGAAIAIDADLLRGCSKRSETYQNGCLASEQNFGVRGIEVWMLSREAADVYYAEAGRPGTSPGIPPRR